MSWSRRQSKGLLFRRLSLFPCSLLRIKPLKHHHLRFRRFSNSFMMFKKNCFQSVCFPSSDFRNIPPQCLFFS